MKLTIAMITGRRDPRLDWIIETLAPQRGDAIEILVVSLHGIESPTERMVDVVRDTGATLSVRVVPPKPTPWQGPHRITPRDCWAKSNAINTALVLCDTEYIAFVDDCCRLGPQWLETVRQGERARASVLAGSYEKIENGQIVQDSRLPHAPRGRTNCGGGWLYGCTYALPLAWALEVNGAEEGLDGMGTEDYTLGLMLQNAGRRIDFVPAMKVTQERTAEAIPGMNRSIPLWRTDKGISPNDKSHAALTRFGARKRAEFTPDLNELRARFRAVGEAAWPMPDPDLRDWYDGQLVREMVPSS